ncbi:hypothetical protein EDB19DRAFT_1641064 [Suillus lakei]|nr:hypothetical protein EDB19DRAFT_1641064 [Suillus lakei]
MREDQREHYKQTDDRLAHLEGSHPHRQTSSATRGCTTQRRGASNVARRRRRRDACEEGNDAESRAGQFDHDAEDVTGARGKLSATAREVRADLKHMITTKFRHVCNVSEGKMWPSPDDERKNETTGEIYLTPNFEATVNDDHNRVIFKKIAHLVWEELGVSFTTLSDSLSNRKVKWNKQSLFTFAKDTYRGFKEEWKAQNDREKAAAKNNNQQKNRWSQRRKEKADRLTTACPKYFELHGADPINIIHADHMSDEASGPEDDGESVDEWRIKMGREKGFPADTDMDGMVFMEVIKNPWRSQELGDIYHKLFQLWKASLNTKQRKRFRTMRVEGTDRVLLRIPDYTPYNFGIDTEWLEENKNHPEYQAQLKEWGAWADPPGFGSAKNEECIAEGSSRQDCEEVQPEDMGNTAGDESTDNGGAECH